MKKFAVLAVFAAVSVSAQAQSAVTLFGTLDVNARYVKNGDNSLKSLSSDGATTSRFGVRGVEDLGDGLQAGFWLESSVKADEGTAGDGSKFWNRRSTISLLGNFGEVRLGRDTVPTYTGSSDYDVFSTAGVATGDKFITTQKLGATAVDTFKRADNQISYFTPNTLSGFYGRASVAAGEGTAGKKYIGGRAGYAKGPLDVSLSYGQTTVAPAGNGDDKYTMVVLGASYDFSVVKLSGYYTQQKFAAQKLAVFNLGAQVPVSQAGVVRVSYVNANASTSGANNLNDGRQFAIGYLHNVSKRTSLYATVAKVSNDTSGAYNVVSSSTLPSLVAGQSSTGYEVGVRHSF